MQYSLVMHILTKMTTILLLHMYLISSIIQLFFANRIITEAASTVSF